MLDTTIAIAREAGTLLLAGVSGGVPGSCVSMRVEEAGGRVTDWRRGPVDLDRGAALASNDLLHDEMAELLATLPLPSAAR